ncbi:MAG: hypothetical protein DMF41_11495 [Verrucomicrobia bacterium]|nr:MAG: hypothetical protein DMF41_11495 [Verrucomicrobiota bacterium]
MKKILVILAVVALSTAWARFCVAQSDAPYTEGTVWNITMVKTKAGLGDQYLKGLAKTLTIAKKVVGSIEEQEKTATQRLEVREIMGAKLMREITLK